MRPSALVISLTLIACTLLPAFAHAGVITDLLVSMFTGRIVEASAEESGSNVQTMPLARAAMNIDPTVAKGGGDIIIVDDSAVMPEEGPAGTLADIEKPKNGTISRYVVRSGDTLSGIAKMYGVSASTILWANNLPKASQIQIGQTLIILPVTGLQYTIKKGDTLASIAKKYGGDADEIAGYNGLGDELVVGTEIIIPDGMLPQSAAPQQTSSAIVRVSVPSGTPEQIGYYLRPIIGGKKSQGAHGYNGVDIAAPVGTPIIASAEGDVVVARQGGWNGGYGSYVVIQHGNGSQTLYAHASRVVVYDGQRVMQGQVVGYVGSTGRSTGPHLHFEIRNGIRNPF